MAYFLDKDASSRTYEHKHEHMNKNNFLLKYVIHVNRILRKYFDTYDKKFVDVEEYFATCPWMNDFNG